MDQTQVSCAGQIGIGGTDKLERTSRTHIRQIPPQRLSLYLVAIISQFFNTVALASAMAVSVSIYACIDSAI